MIANILEQIAVLIKQANTNLKQEIIKEIRTSEANIRSDIAYKRNRVHKTKQLITAWRDR